MKKFDDRRLYFYFSVVTAVTAAVLAALACYSMCRIEPRVKALLSGTRDIDRDYRRAYLVLRRPQVFARYENFDDAAQPVKFILREFDRRIHGGERFTGEDRVYLDILLERRMQGSRLTRNTFVFFALLSVMGWVFYFYERSRA